MPEPAELVEEALALIDTGLSDLQSRELVSATEVANLLLDLRLLLMQAEGDTDRLDAITTA